MFNGIRNFFSAPVFADEEKTRRAKLTSIMLHVIFASVLMAGLGMFLLSPADFLSNWVTPFVFGVMLLATLGLRFVLWRGHVRAVSISLVVLVFVIITLSLYAFGGVSNSTTVGYLLCIVIASLLLGERATVIMLILSVAALLAVWYGGEIGLIAPVEEAPLFDLIANSTIFVIIGLLLRNAVNSLAMALERARRNEQAQITANRELEALRESLEQQVAVRTQDLERRSAYLEATAQTGRVVTSILETELLLRRVVDLIRDRFDLYHVALFLLDASGQWAEFRAGTGEVGRLLQEQEFRLKIDEDSMVGWCVKHTQARVAQDTGAFSQRVGYPDLPEARSEAALPLIARGRVLGALSAQSARTGAFDADAVAVLQTLADQVAVALDNARLFSETQSALEAERRAYGEISREAWANAVRDQSLSGYSYVNQQITPIFRGAVASADEGRVTVALPITVRGATIGQVNLHRDAEANPWTKEEIALMQTLIEQLGLALDSARLYQDTQQRAAQERLIGEVTGRMRESLDVEWVLRTAARELGEALGVSRVSVRLVEPQSNTEGAA